MHRTLDCRPSGPRTLTHVSCLMQVVEFLRLYDTDPMTKIEKVREDEEEECV